MRLSLLAKREPLSDIVEQTLAGFLSRWQQRPHEVRWYPGRPRLAAIRNGGGQPWLCNFYLNAMFPLGVDPQALEPMKREFSRSPRWWCRPLQKLYVDLAFSPSTAPLFAHAALGISPPLAEAAGLVFVAGNHKLRLLDRRRGEVHGMLKKGFPPATMQRELTARKLAAELGLPVPALKAAAADGSWFTEAYVSGTPLNRLADKGQARRSLELSVEALGKLITATRREEDLGAYAEGLAEQVHFILDESHLISEDHKQTALRALASLMCQLNMLRPAVDNCVFTSLTHGDFQPGNILVDYRGPWLIDWEYAGRRQCGYDALVFGLRSRFPRGLARRLKSFLNGEKESLSFLNMWPGLSRENAHKLRASVLLWLVEELVFYLQENINPLFRAPGQGLLDFLRELESLVEVA